MISFDISPLVPEARVVAAAAARTYLRLTEPWFVGLLSHGSALKGGFIPGCSDVDFQLYLDPAAFSEAGVLPFELSAAIQRDLAQIDPRPFSYIQCYAHPCALPAGQVGPIPGAYALLAGRLPVPEATEHVLLESARRTLSRLQPCPEHLRSGLLEHGDGRLQQHVRWLCTDVWPVLYQLLTLRTGEPMAVWRLPKPDAIALLPEAEPAGHAIRAFDAATHAYYPAQSSVEAALAVLRGGLAFRRSVCMWWTETHGSAAREAGS